jgi:hypothetical protein
MNSPSPRPPHKRKSNSPKLKQPRPLILAMMLTGVLVIETYPTAIEAIARSLGDVLPGSQTVVAETAVPAAPDPDPPLRKAIAGQSTCDSPNICDRPVGASFPELLFVSLENRLKPIPLEFPDLFPAEKRVGIKPTRVPGDLPPEVAAAVRQDIARSEGIDINRLEIVEIEPQIWPDTCLGLAGPDEFCGQMLVEGWRLKVSDGDRSWTYRTDARGNALRPEPPDQTLQIPPAVDRLLAGRTPSIAFRGIAPCDIPPKTDDPPFGQECEDLSR